MDPFDRPAQVWVVEISRLNRDERQAPPKKKAFRWTQIGWTFDVISPCDASVQTGSVQTKCVKCEKRVDRRCQSFARNR
jgi:hypothetical protein